MTLDRCGSKGNHDVTGGEAVRMPIKLWEPVEKSSCIPAGGDIRSPMKQNATGGATGDEQMARWFKVRSISERTLAMLLHTILLIPLCKP